LEKLRSIFVKRGFDSTTAIITGAISANSVQTAPALLAKSVTAVALAKGATASLSTLTLIKGALKLMAWTKAKTAIVAGVVALLVAGTTTTVVVKEIQHRRMFAWQVPKLDPVNFGEILASAPPQVQIVPSKFSKNGGLMGQANGYVDPKTGIAVGHTDEWLYVGICVPADDIIRAAYKPVSLASLRTVFSAEIPKGNYDFISDLPNGSATALQEEVKKKFGVVGKWEMIETNVLVLRRANPNAPKLKTTATPDESSSYNHQGEFKLVNMQFSSVANFLEHTFETPVVDQTGLTGSFDVDLKWNYRNDSQHLNLKQALYDQLGLELVPGTAPVKMLVIEKTN
jgi:uncharacterized protein (TIGR03435 family)